MADRKATPKPAPKGQNRDDRLKAALKANMARRKAQARARSAETEASNGPAGSGKESS